MISAEHALRIANETNLGVPKDINSWLDEKIERNARKGWHHLTIIAKEIEIMFDEFGVDIPTFKDYVKRAGYKVSYDADDGSYVLRWE